MGNPDGSIGASYGVRWPVIGYFRRATFVVGKDGTIAASFRAEMKPEAHATWALQSLSATASSS